jgi:hypothetical protein
MPRQLLDDFILSSKIQRGGRVAFERFLDVIDNHGSAGLVPDASCSGAAKIS